MYWVRRLGDMIVFSPTLTTHLAKSMYKYAWTREGISDIKVHFDAVEEVGREYLKLRDTTRLMGPAPSWLLDLLDEGYYYVLLPHGKPSRYGSTFHLTSWRLTLSGLLGMAKRYVYVEPLLGEDGCYVYLSPSLVPEVTYGRVYYELDSGRVRFSFLPRFDKASPLMRIRRPDLKLTYFYLHGGKGRVDEGIYLVEGGPVYTIGDLLERASKAQFLEAVKPGPGVPRPDYARMVEELRSLIGRGMTATQAAKELGKKYGRSYSTFIKLKRLADEGMLRLIDRLGSVNRAYDELLKMGRRAVRSYAKGGERAKPPKKPVTEAVRPAPPKDLADLRRRVARLVEDGKYEEAMKLVPKLERYEELLRELEALRGELA